MFQGTPECVSGKLDYKAGASLALRNGNVLVVCGTETIDKNKGSAGICAV
jgi:hypothetical protein